MTDVYGERSVWLLRQVAELYPTRTALSHNDVSFTYRELMGAVDKQIDNFNRAGLQQYDLLTIGDTSPEATICTLFAAREVGIHLCVLGDRSDVDFSQLSGSSGERIETNVQGAVCAVRNAQFSTESQDPLTIFATSGTTGRPRLVAHSSTSLLCGLRNSYAAMAEMLQMTFEEEFELSDIHLDLARKFPMLSQGSTFASSMPLSSIAGYTVMQRALLTGDHLCVVSSQDASTLYAGLRGAHYASLNPLTASLLLRVHRSGEFHEAPQLIHIGVGGGPVDLTVAQQLESFFGCIVTIGYGMTETGGPVLMSRATDESDVRLGSVGRPLPGVDVSLRRLPEDLRSGLSDESLGELLVRSPSNMLGYIEYGKLAFLSDAVETGDIVEMLDGSSLTVRGRLSLRAIRGGRNIDLVAVENFAASHERVSRAVALIVPSSIVGEDDVVLFVQAAHELSQGQIRKWWMSSGSNIPCPQRFMFLENLPLTADGAYSRAKLMQQLDAGV